jgi:hypothetical protein
MMHSSLSNTWFPEIASRETQQRYRTKVDLGHAFGMPELSQTLRQFRDVAFMVGSFYSGADKTLKDYVRSSQEATAYNKLRALVSSENSLADIDSLTVTAEAALEAVAEFGPEIIPTKDLSGLQIHGEHLATLLRATYVWRNEISGWNEALDVARQALVDQGIDPDDALYGMVKSL